jgi:predicted  nucleic acid-binding Zn-ribbon protein
LKKKLLLLEELQTIDGAIDDKQAEQAAHQAGITEFEQRLAAARSALAEEQACLADIERAKAELEAALQVEQDNIKRSETNMKEIRTNKEFQAVGREIAAARKQVAELEEQILGKTGQQEELQTAIDAHSAELDSLEEAAGAGRKERQEAIDGLQGIIGAAVANREKIVKELPSSVVRRYSQLREQRRGQALAEAREGSCLGCNMQLPPQLYNTLFKGDELHFCPHCQRILLLKQEQG